MTEQVIGCNLTVICADGTEHTDIVLKIINDKVLYVTLDGEELKADTAVEKIEAGNFLAPLFIVAQAVDHYRRQS